MELFATMALDREAINTVTLRLLPPSATNVAAPSSSTSSSPWLLIHSIPITASLSRTLSRLVSIKVTAAARASSSVPLDSAITTTQYAEQSPQVKAPLALDSSATKSPGTTSNTTSSLTKGEVETQPKAASVSPVTVPQKRRRGSHRSGPRKINVQRSSSLSSTSSSSSSQTAVTSSSALSCAQSPDFNSTDSIEVVRVGYIVSEIHAYCILVRCGSSAQAGEIKAKLEEGAALSLTAPVEYVSDAGLVVMTHRTYARSSDGEGVMLGAKRDANLVHGDETTRTRRTSSRWRAGVHETSLWKAATSVYPVHRDTNDYSDDDELREPKEMLHESHELLYHHSHMGLDEQETFARSSARLPLSPPQSPPLPRQSPSTFSSMRAYGGGGAAMAARPHEIRKGAAPPVPKRHAGHATISTAQVAATREMTGPLSPPLSAAVSPSVAASAPAMTQTSTPLHLPQAKCVPQSGDFCSICLDPLHLSSCVTTLCQHSFHLSCYAKLPSTSSECPLCRFSVYDLLNDARCRVCGTYEDLWACLICGHVACGRARHDHQQDHYHASGHSCSWQSSTNRIRNLSSGMFLHQEVALLLDDVDDTPGAPAKQMTVTGSGGDAALTCVSGTDAVRSISWWDSSMDTELQEALNESKEEAVAAYYTEFLHHLVEEQQRWYEARLSKLEERRRRQQRRRVNALPRSPDGESTERSFPTDETKKGHLNTCISCEASHPSSTAVLTLVRDERRQRRCILTEYVKEMILIFEAVQQECSSISRSLRSARDEAQQQVLLSSHYNAGLAAHVGQVRRRAHDLKRSGELTTQQKEAEVERLQRLVDETLSAL